MTDRRIIIGAIIVIFIVIAVLITIPSLWKNLNLYGNTQISVANAGNSWIHCTIVFENSTLPNKTSILYSESFIKPNDAVKVDLSQNLGVDGPLPDNTTLRMKIFVELQNANRTKPTLLNMTMQGWSNTSKPTSSENIVQIQNNTNNVWPLTSGLKESNIEFTKIPSQGIKLIRQIRSLYYEFLVTVNSTNHSVTITPVITPDQSQLDA